MHEKITLNKAGRFHESVELYIQGVYESLCSTYKLQENQEILPKIHLDTSGFYKATPEGPEYILEFTAIVGGQPRYSKKFVSTFKSDNREEFEEEVGKYFLSYVQVELMTLFLLSK
jgi:hypothetical protein